MPKDHEMPTPDETAVAARVLRERLLSLGLADWMYLARLFHRSNWRGNRACDMIVTTIFPDPEQEGG